MEQQPIRYTVRVDDMGAADAARAVESLRAALQESSSEIRATRDETHDDLSYAVAVTLSASAIALFAETLIGWLKRERVRQKVTLTSDGILIAENINSLDSSDLVGRLERYAAARDSEQSGGVQISGEGNVVVSGRVIGIEPVEPWPEPGKRQR